MAIQFVASQFRGHPVFWTRYVFVFSRFPRWIRERNGVLEPSIIGHNAQKTGWPRKLWYSTRYWRLEYANVLATAAPCHEGPPCFYVRGKRAAQPVTVFHSLSTPHGAR